MNCQYCDSVTKREITCKMCKCLKLLPQLWNLVVSKPENLYLTRKTATRLYFRFVWQVGKRAIFFSDTKQQSDQIKRKILAKFNKLFSISIDIFKSQNHHRISSKATRCITLELLRKPILPVTSQLWTELFCSLIYIKKIQVFFFKKTDLLQSELFLDFNSPRLDQTSITIVFRSLRTLNYFECYRSGYFVC